MGWDVKATADAVGEALERAPSLGEVQNLIPTLEQLRPYNGLLMIVGPLLIAIAILFFTRFGVRLRKVLSDVFFTNWQLALLGTAALVLSLAGGWTTWDGMTNFTGEPVLSLMFTFGIHGVMLIVAWLIGESFATGMSTVPRGGYGRVTAPLIVVVALGIVLLAAAAGIYQWQRGFKPDYLMQGLMFTGAALIGLGLIVFFAKSDVVAPYAQAARIIAKNSMLWVMFLACMSTSVFFAFDSRFNVIFPKDQRERAAEIRTKNQISAVVADIGETITKRRVSEAEAFFASTGWNAYEEHLVALTKASEGADADIEAHFVKQLEGQRRAIAEQQERIATSTSGQAGLSVKKANLTEELSRLEADRPQLVTELAQKKTELDDRAKEVDAKRVEAMAEDKGVEGTLKEGKGPIYRQRMAELGKLQDYYKIGEQRVKDAQKRVDDVNGRIDQLRRQLAEIDGALAKLKGEADTATQRIKASEESQIGGEGPRVDPSRVRAAFEKARAEFRQQPDSERLAMLQQHCTQLYDAMIATEATKDRVRNIDCDPKQASEAAAVVFALNSGLRAFDANCAGGEKMPATGGTTALIDFGRRCLQDSGLPGRDANKVGQRISAIDLNRDDKAHNFVVSWNAFQDGNRLAYLALAIAIGIDSLIFMAGLFGANAVRSPLSDVPTSKPRNAQQLESIIENALLPDKFENATLALEAMRPITPRDGFTAEVIIPREETPIRQRVLKVLNAGATIGAVEHDPVRPGRYLARPELFEFLSIVAKKEFESSPQHVDIAELEKVVAVALLPVDRMGANAETVLSYMHPISEDRGFTAEIKLGEVVAHDMRLVRSTLNAAATVDRVQRVGNDANHFWIHRDLYKTLARLRARTLSDGARAREGYIGIRGEERPQPLEVVGEKVSPPEELARLGPPSREPERRDGPPPIPPAGGERDRLVQRYWDQFVARLGLEQSGMTETLDNEAVRKAAADCWDALADLGQRNETLSSVLRDAERGMENVLDRIYGELRSAAEGDERKIDALDVAHHRMQQAETVLLLLPKFGLIGQLIDGLEAAAASDNGPGPGEQRLKERLQAIEDDLQGLDVADADSWRQIIESTLLETTDEGMPPMPNLQAARERKTRLN